MHVSKHTHSHTDHHSLVSHNSTPHHGIFHINWCCLVAIFTPLQPLRQIHYSLISRTWPFIKLGHVKQSHRAVCTDSAGIFSCMWMAAAKCDCIYCLYPCSCAYEFMWESMRESSLSLLSLCLSLSLSKGSPLLHVRSAQKSRAHTAPHQRQQPSGATADKRATSKTSNGAKVKKKPAEKSLQ